MRVLAAFFVTTLAAVVACRGGESDSKPKHSDLPSGRSSSADAQGLCLQSTASNGKVDGALERARAVARKRPDVSGTWAELGRLWMQKARATEDPGFYHNVRACADAALALEPHDSAALNLKGFAHLNEHEFRAARDLAEGILARHADDRLAWGTLSDALLELGDVEGAERAAQRMLDLKPDAASYGRAAHLRWLRGDRAGAKRVYEQALQVARQAPDPELYAWMLVQAAHVFWYEGDAAGADAGFRLALERLADYAPALVGRARIALSEQRFAEAVELLERACKRSPSVESAWLLGNARSLAGDERGAAVAFQRAVAAGRHDPGTLALFYASTRRNLDEAVRLARRAHDERPNAHGKDVLAWTLYRSGKIAEALDVSEQALRWGTPDPRLLFHAGAIRMAAGDPANKAAGRQLVRRALALNAAFDPFEALEAQRLLGSGA